VTAVALQVAAYAWPGARTALSDGAWTAAALAGVIGAAAAVGDAQGNQRHGWRLILGACAVWLLGQLLYDLYGATSFPSSPNLADLSWLAFAVLAAAGVHRLGLGAVRRRRLSWLEVAPLVAAVVALTTALMWQDILDSRLPLQAQLTVLAYPVFYVSAAMIMLQSVLAGAMDLGRNRGMGAVLAGLILEALAFILWSPQLLAATYTPGATPIDALWTLGLLAVGIGAWRARPVRRVAAFGDVVRRRGGVLPALTFLTLACVQVAFVATHQIDGAELALSVGVLIVGGALIVRSEVLRRQQGALLERLRQRESELQVANRRLGEESRQDPLTGLANRLRLREDFAELASRFARSGEPYCLVLLDLDHFKAFNDHAGHQAGDTVLREVAQLLEDGTRGEDRVYRYGGEEILLVLLGQDEEGGQAVADRHLAALRRAALAHPANPPSRTVTLSGGVAAVHPGETPEHVLRRADDALYEAKAQGRDRTAIAAPPHASLPARRAPVILG
jgi:diguanylate cyclase (GGDEF)-like protein